MTCEDAIEQLPLRLNGSLTADENAAIDAHVASCVRCRQALADVGFMMHAVATSHPPVEALTDVAFGEANEEQRARVTDHVARCRPCAEALAMAEESAREEAREHVFRWDWRPILLQAAVLALTLGAFAFMGWGWRSAHRAVTAEVAQRETAVAALALRDADLQRVHDRAAQLEADADARARDATRGLDLEAMDTVHVQTLMSGGGDDGAQVTPGTGNGVRLSIQGSLDWPVTVGVEVRDSTARLVALRLNLPRSDEGPYQLPIPPAWLARVGEDDALTVKVFTDSGAARQVLETYTVHWPSFER